MLRVFLNSLCRLEVTQPTMMLLPTLLHLVYSLLGYLSVCCFQLLGFLVYDANIKLDLSTTLCVDWSRPK
jgi:hypothetical protein